MPDATAAQIVVNTQPGLQVVGRTDGKPWPMPNRRTAATRPPAVR